MSIGRADGVSTVAAGNLDICASNQTDDAGVVNRKVVINFCYGNTWTRHQVDIANRPVKLKETSIVKVCYFARSGNVNARSHNHWEVRSINVGVKGRRESGVWNGDVWVVRANRKRHSHHKFV